MAVLMFIVYSHLDFYVSTILYLSIYVLRIVSYLYLSHTMPYDNFECVKIGFVVLIFASLIHSWLSAI
jgi:hypothetical protein